MPRTLYFELFPGEISEPELERTKNSTPIPRFKVPSEATQIITDYQKTKNPGLTGI